MPNTSRPLAFIAAGTLALALAAPAARAQDYRETSYYSNGAGEQIEVIAPRHHDERSVIGAPIRDVAISQAVRFDDLDLRTQEGAHILRARVRDAARDLCRRLDTRYPISTDDSPPCYSTALDDAMAQADRAIDDAREYGNAE